MSDEDEREWRREQEEHDMNITKFNATKWTVELAALREMQAIRRQTAERLELLEDDLDPEALDLLKSSDINGVAARFHRRIERLRAWIWREKFTAGPIHRLPVEMLSEIFSYYVEFDLSPWGLAKVCKTWMHTALRTPQLWRRIQFTNDESMILDDPEYFVVDGRREFFLGNVQLCFNPAQINAAVTRSGAMPLEVTIKHVYNAYQSSNIDLSSTIALLVKDPTSRRIRSLDITCTEPTEALITPGQFTCLKEISWNGATLPWTLQLFRMISATSTDLEIAKLSCVLPSELVELSFWSRIKTVTLLNNSSNSELNKVAHNLTSLEGHFEGYYEWPNSYTPDCYWPSIRSLSLHCSPLNLANLRLPRLERLEINEARMTTETHNPPALIFPSVTTLTLITSAVSAVGWLSSASFPRLTKLDLDCTWTQEDENCSIFRSILLPTVRDLTMGHRWNDFSVIAAFKSVPNVVYLRLIGTIRPWNCRILVLNRLRDRTDATCLRLASLFLGDEIWPVYTQRDSIVPAITQLVRARKRMNIPLQELTVRWGPEIRTVGDVMENFA